MNFSQKVGQIYPNISEDKLEQAVETGIKFARTVKEFGSLSFAITAWHNNGNRTEDRLLILADEHFNA